jgi:hypothetical protein
VPLVMSGDLTRLGTVPDEFVVGRSLFEGRWTDPSGLPTRQLGLALGGGGVHYIPGNHDHWAGDNGNQWGYNPAVQPQYLPSTPWHRTLSRNGGKLVVELFGVDSCSGFGEDTNRLGRGCIAQAEFDELARLLVRSASARPQDEKNGVRRVRVFVCHHSLQGNWLISWWRGALELEEASRSRLLELAGTYRVAAVLTGHTHDFLTERYDTPGGVPGHRLREFRSGTTLQGRARLFKQGLYGHRVRLRDDGEVWWTTFPYQWQGSHFYPMAVDQGPPLPGEWNPFHFRVI